jgi:hypothetical protein
MFGRGTTPSLSGRSKHSFQNTLTSPTTTVGVYNPRHEAYVNKANVQLVAPTTEFERLNDAAVLLGVVTLIPDESGIYAGTMVTWRGVTRPRIAYPDASLGPRARPPTRSGFPARYYL